MGPPQRLLMVLRTLVRMSRLLLFLLFLLLFSMVCLGAPCLTLSRFHWICYYEIGVLCSS